MDSAIKVLAKSNTFLKPGLQPSLTVKNPIK